MATSQFNMSFDTKTREQFSKVLQLYGLTVPQAFKLFANQVIRTGKVPLSFDWADLEVKDNIAAVLKQNEQEKRQGKSTVYKNFDELMDNLKHE
ncbi:addiction module antitoxin [Pelistega indica]|uniref:Addiction module antitoxin n=1 Tax=Pelistega indica TaxID=1414851 RepID=V8FRU9_9BURK|nr:MULTISPECIES: type II toxin-antitoxin system RelB/DinJ family antitoxin [Pelistega]ETD66606.1 addiction module antitoxin [Pelistega indica]